jgi:acyl-CoA hydrolase
MFSFRPTEYVNDANVIGQHNNMVTINMALEIDLTGQVSSDSENGSFYSGIGGQVDFNRGAARSSGRRPILVMPSTSPTAGQSRIVNHVSVPAQVWSSRVARFTTWSLSTAALICTENRSRTGLWL